MVEEIYNRSKLYVLVSLAAGLLYSGVLVGTTLLIGDRLLAEPHLPGAVVAGVVAIVWLLILSGATRERFQRAIDRRFYREKYKFDLAMQKMNLAVGRLVDRPTLGQRLLEAAAEVLHLEWGAIYLAEGALATRSGPGGLARPRARGRRSLPTDNPLVERLRRTSTVLAPHSMALVPASDPATDTMIALGGEVARALEADGQLVGLMVLGPKRSGLPYEDEEKSPSSGALGSVAMPGAPLRGDPADPGAAQPGTSRQGRKDRRAAAANPPAPGPAHRPRPGRRSPASPGLRRPTPGVFGEIRGSGQTVRRMLEVARKVAPSQAGSVS